MKRVVIFIGMLCSCVSVPAVSWAHVELVKIECEPATVHVGDQLAITLQINPTRELEHDFFMFCHLEGTDGTKGFVNADIFPPVPTSTWKVNEPITVGPFYVHVPDGTSPGTYRLKLGLARLIETPLGTTYKKLPWEGKNDHYLKNLFILPSVGGISKGLRVGFLEGVYKVFKEKKLFGAHSLFKKKTLFAAQNEYELAEAVVIAGERDLTCHIEAGDLTSTGGRSRIAKENIHVYRVDYVTTKKPYYNTRHIGLWPDPLVQVASESVTIPKETVQPFLVEVFVPPNTEAGTYEGVICLAEKDTKKYDLRLAVTVFNFALPQKSKLKTAFDTYEYLFYQQFPQGEFENRQLYEMKIRRLIDEMYVDMLAHRVSPIRNVGVPELLGGQKDNLAFDFSEFGKRFEFFLSKGQETFGIGYEWPRWKNQEWPQDKWYAFRSPQALVETYAQIEEYLKKRGLLQKCYTYILDETYDRVQELYGLVHRGSPGIKNLLTATPDLQYSEVDIWCVRINNLLRPQVEEARAAGKEIWMYVAGATRPFPSLHIDVPALEARIIPWICFSRNVKGFLYWCINWWPHNPLENAMTFTEQNGNGFLYYPAKDAPEVIPSLRLKLFREGMEDYAYLSRLNELLAIKEGIPETVAQEAERLLSLSGLTHNAAPTTADIKDLDEVKIKMGRLIEALEAHEN